MYFKLGLYICWIFIIRFNVLEILKHPVCVFNLLTKDVSRQRLSVRRKPQLRCGRRKVSSAVESKVFTFLTEVLRVYFGLIRYVQPIRLLQWSLQHFKQKQPTPTHPLALLIIAITTLWESQFEYISLVQDNPIQCNITYPVYEEQREFGSRKHIATSIF